MKLPIFGALFLCAAGALCAKVSVAPLFTDHCVLQRDKPVPIWGQANPGETVTVEFHGLAASATADMSSTWTAHLPALGATGKGGDLVVRGDNTITLHDVVVGEVWLCSGQSNMEFPVDKPKGLQVLNAPEEVAAAHYPLIRQFTAVKQASDIARLHVPGKWDVCSPETVGHFSAAGYFFARDLMRRLTVPIGIIDSSWGGTAIELWINPSVLTSDPAFAQLHPGPAGPVLTAKGSPAMPGSLYNGMIAPLVPYGLRGILWYQGESDAHPGLVERYHGLFTTLITSWRKEFGQGDLPFYWVQLASYGHSAAWPLLREAQQQTLSLPNTGQAVAIDIGEEANIHPRNKQEVGRRLALIAANQVYKVPIEYCGPMFANAEVAGDAMRVWFNFCADGLRADQPVETCEVAGADRKFYAATAKVEGNALVVRSDQVPKPVAVRYAWKGFAEGHLYNSAGLPAAPFRSDSW